MALEIVWTPRAKRGYDDIIEYLTKNWTDREVGNFVKETFTFLGHLSEYPELLRASNKKNVRRGPMNKHTILTYRIKPRKKQIQLINIRAAKQKPLK